ncbi:MAG: hypothetical protein LBE92_17090 [Chryseobacterium sp.]|jgi:hypothetical protein|uniref:DUF7822 domain-containing protein n=1 Tax=Chryseobacterium sp. TaxID=1871047 RepID=UPI00282F01BF|nr:hypothetical protein [Chryseobacterium sp.]MDR2237841.1 hypothetical protein [Chryseobacterium sp.]
MANRSYLYTASKELTQLRDVSEWNYDIPLFYKIVLGSETQMSASKIWNFELPIVIKGDFKNGLKKFYDFLDYLETQQDLDKEAIAGYRQDTLDFFEKYPERALDLFFMEGGEIFDMTGDVTPIEQQNEALYHEIISISKDIDDILNQKPDNVFDFKHTPWLQEIKKDINALSVYWTYVTYFSFNKS